MLLGDQNKIHFALGVHNHQPIGNWDHVIEDGYQHSYLPFIDVLERHPHVHVTAHYAGHLLLWLAEHRPEFIERLRALVARGQIEITTGGFYEPVLSAIPDDDKIGQIRKLTETVRSLLGYEPVGAWLTGRIWEQYLAKPMAEAGVRYTMVDDTHFKAAGFHSSELWGYYETEEQGESLSMFPINREMRAIIPFQPPEKAIEFLRQHATSDGNRLALCVDDGAKFGSWPNTYQAVYLDGWLDRFFTLLKENEDWIASCTVSEYRESQKAWGRAYLPACAYEEMQLWSLPPEQATLYDEARQKVDPRYADFLRGGYWRHFLVKYPEANNLHKKMLRVASQVKAASRIQQAVAVGPETLDKNDGLLLAKDALWRGQSNDPYWHGVYGGLYLNHLRSANYSALLQAESEADRLRYGQDAFCELEMTDFDRDGNAEALISTQDQNVYLKPAYGGALFEHDIKARSYNLLNTLSRRPEAYHTVIPRAAYAGDLPNLPPTAIGERAVSKESGLERFLHYDWYRRFSLLDHFLHPDTRLETFHNMSYGEQGDFINQPYELATRETDDGLMIEMHRDGHVWVGPEFWPVRVEKSIFVPRQGAGFTADYRVINKWERPLTLWFGVEFNLNMRAGTGHEHIFYSAAGRQMEPANLGAMMHEEHIREIGLRDETMGLDIHLAWNESANLWRFPLETVSRSEAGFERVYQSSVVMPHWRLNLEAGGSWSCRLEQQVTTL